MPIPTLRKIILCTFLLISSAEILSYQDDTTHPLASMLTVQQMKQDIDSWLNWVDATHPNVAIRFNRDHRFKTRVKELMTAIDKPMNQQQFLAHISQLNSEFNDGHMNLFLPSQSKIIDYAVEQGQGLFPFEVLIDNGRLFITSALGGENSSVTGQQIIGINGRDVSQVYAQLIARGYGDTEQHRAALLANKFALYYWLFIEQKETFQLTLSDNKVITVPATRNKPRSLQRASFEQQFDFQILDDKSALLTINLFWWQDKQRFYDFTKSVFTTIKKKNIKHLIIDVRKNFGGDDDMWKQGILTYIADKPYRHTHAYVKKIIAKYMDEGETEGDVVSKEYDKFEQAHPEHPLHFNGKVTVLVGSLTYSSAILFANTVQDFGFGEVAGQPSAGYSWQTGGIQFFTLPHSDLRGVCPRFYLQRPNGKGAGEAVIPNRLLPDDPLAPSILIDRVAVEFAANQ